MDDFLGSSVVLGHAEDIDDAPLQVRNRDLLASVFDVPDAEERPFRAPHGTDDNALLGQDLRPVSYTHLTLPTIYSV